MAGKDILMQEIFNELTENNQDIMILIAKSMKLAQEDSKQQHDSPKQVAV